MLEDNRVTYISIMGKRFPLCFTVAAQERVNREFGGLVKMFDSLGKDADGAPSAMVALLHILMEGGAARERAISRMNGSTADIASVPDLDALKNLVTVGDVNTYKKTIFQAIQNATSVTVEVEPEKNVKTTQG